MAIFQEAERQAARLRMCISGAPGSGKTMTALRIGSALLSEDGALAVIDTEHGESHLYAGAANPDGGTFAFHVADISGWNGRYSVENYIRCLDAAAHQFEVVIIDSLSHAWAGPGGVLEVVDKASNGKFSGWRVGTPLHDRLVDAVCSFPGHVIVTLRSKMGYVVSDDGKRITRAGMQPIQRDSIEYEFSVVGDMSEGTLAITKHRNVPLSESVIHHPGAGLAMELLDWLGQGRDTIAEFWAAVEYLGFERDAVEAVVKARSRPHPDSMTFEQRQRLLTWLNTDEGEKACQSAPD